MSKAVCIFPSVQQEVLVDVVIGFPDIINPIRNQKGVICHALIDTGAMISAISKRVADYLELPVTGSETVTAANMHTDTVNTHIVNISIGKEILFPLVQVSCLDMQGEDMIIGMDLLSQGDLIISNSDGHTIFMFEMKD